MILPGNRWHERPDDVDPMPPYQGRARSVGRYVIEARDNEDARWWEYPATGLGSHALAMRYAGRLMHDHVRVRDRVHDTTTPVRG